MSSLIITISRTSLGLTPLVLSGSEDGTPLGVTGYTEPAPVPQVHYAPDSPHENGSIPLSVTWPLTIVGFSVVANHAATESEMKAKIAELRTAIAQFSYDTTVAVNDAPAETWACHPGSLTPVGGRTSVDLQHYDPEWSVTIPAQPFPTTA